MERGRRDSKVKGREDSEVNTDVMVFRCLVSALEIQQAFGTEHEELEPDVDDLA